MKGKIREEHKEQIERWANYVKEHPNEWKLKLKPFLDAQIIIARRAYKQLSESEEGRKSILELRNQKDKDNSDN